jgi:hypothetical protein
MMAVDETLGRIPQAVVEHCRRAMTRCDSAYHAVVEDGDMALPGGSPLDFVETDGACSDRWATVADVEDATRTAAEWHIDSMLEELVDGMQEE